MKKYILIWNVNDYDCGIEFEKIDSEKELIEKVNELKKDSRVEIEFCSEIRDEIQFKAVEKVTEWAIDDCPIINK